MLHFWSVHRSPKILHFSSSSFLFRWCKCQEKRIPSAFEEFSKFSANFVEFVPRDLALSQPIITFPHNSIAPEITPTQAAQQFWFSSWSVGNHIRFKYFAQRMLNHPSIIERKNQDIWRYWLHSKAYNSPQWWLDLNSPLSFQFAIEDERVYFLGKESSEPGNAFLAGTGLSGQFSRDRDCYSIWKYMPTLCERKSRDIQLLDKRLSSLSRHPGALNDLLATLLMKNTAFKNRAWKRVENYEEDNRTKHHVYVSMESTT